MKKVLLFLSTLILSASIFCAGSDVPDVGSEVAFGLETREHFTKNALNEKYEMNIPEGTSLQEYINEIRDRKADETGLHTQSHIELETLLKNLKALKSRILTEIATDAGYTQYGLGFAYSAFTTNPRITQINHYINQTENAIHIIHMKDQTPMQRFITTTGPVILGVTLGVVGTRWYTETQKSKK